MSPLRDATAAGIHPSERVVGRIRRDRGWDRRYRLPLELPEPYEHDVRRTVIEVVVGVPIFGALFLGVPLLLFLIGGPS